MAPLIHAPTQQCEEPLPSIIDRSNAYPARENGSKKRGITKFGQRCEFVLSVGQAGGQLLAPLGGVGAVARLES